MKQFVRIFRDPSSGEIAHVHTQGSPIEHDAIAVDGVTFAREDMELDDDAEADEADEGAQAAPYVPAVALLAALSNPGKTKLAKLDATKLPPGVKVGKHAKR